MSDGRNDGCACIESSSLMLFFLVFICHCQTVVQLAGDLSEFPMLDRFVVESGKTSGINCTDPWC